MKTKKLNSTYRFTLLYFSIFLAFNLHAQVIDKSIVKSTKIASNILVDVKSSSTDVTIKTWDKNELKVEYKIYVEGKSQEELSKFYNKLKNSVEQQLSNVSSGVVHVSFPVKKVMRNNHKVTIVFKNDKHKYQLTDFKKSMIIYAPIGNNLNLQSSFSKVSMDNLNANAKINLSSSKFSMGDCKKLKIIASFCKNMKCGNVENADLVINSSDLEMGTIKNNLLLAGNFSKFIVEKIGNSAVLSLSSSTFKTSDIKELKLAAKFVRKFEVNVVDNAEISLSSSEFEAAKINNIKVNKASFSTFNIGEVKNLVVPSSSSSKFYIKTVNSIEAGNCSFSDFIVDRLNTKLTVKSNSGKIKLKDVSAAFNEISIHGQFVTIDINIDNSCSYKLSGNLDFPNYKFENINYQNHIKNMNHEEFNGWKGSKDKAKASVKLNCKSCKINLS